ncbi:MAG: fimbrillin family protein [Bacteroidales bacterium]|nr:fimbrillin family protein [Bacteroidales bacterium]
MLLASCSSDSSPSPEREGQQPITLSASGEEVSRVTGPLSADYAMYIVGLLHHDGHTSAYIDDRPFTLGSDNLWTSTFYWPLSGTMDFCGYALLHPSEHKPSVAYFTDAEGQVGSLTLDFGTTLDGTDDPLCSNRVVGVECPYNSSVALNFSHALSRLTFNISAADDETKQRLKIKSCTIYDIGLSGDVAVTYAADHAPVFSWTSAGEDDCSIDATSTFVEENPLSFSLNILPQQAATSFTITYTIDNGNAVDTPSYLTPELTYTSAFPAITWQAGMEYVYNLSCSLTEFTFTAYVAYWKIEIDLLTSLKDWIDGGEILEQPGVE